MYTQQTSSSPAQADLKPDQSLSMLTSKLQTLTNSNLGCLMAPTPANLLGSSEACQTPAQAQSLTLAEQRLQDLEFILQTVKAHNENQKSLNLLAEKLTQVRQTVADATKENVQNQIIHNADIVNSL